jgi:16S rRNA (cytosine1402-N4)-methyltransferase
LNSNGESPDLEKADLPGHVPVLLDKAIELLNIRAGLTYVDATAGGGGHLAAIDEVLKGEGRLIANDRDACSLGNLRKRFADRPIDYIHADYSDLSSGLSELGITTVSGGILADLGVSSMQIDDPARGFSFGKDGPLDMRMDNSQSLSADDLVNGLSEVELADIIFKYGEERHSRGIARNIVRNRPLHSTARLAEVVASAVRRSSGKSGHQRRSDGSVALHPATRTFQALRIAVNTELDSLKNLLEQSSKLLAPGARLVVITFHSLEDRLVKDFFRLQASDCICPPRQPVCTCDKKQQFLIINRKPFVPDEKEVLANIRSRSAKLRAGEKLS